MHANACPNRCACLPPLLSATALRRYVRGIGLNGTLPPDWGSDGGLLKLRQLWIDGNNLSGGCPHSRCPGGMKLVRSNCRSSSWQPVRCMPPSRSLTCFAACCTLTAGTIPAEWTNLPSLEYLFVKPGNPKLCGPLPEGVKFKVRACAYSRCALEVWLLLAKPCLGGQAGHSPASGHSRGSR